MGYDSVSSEERDALKIEVDRLIFTDTEYAEQYLREYVEPQLARKCAHTEIWILENEPAFSHLREKLSIEWLERYPDLSLNSLDTLFDIAVKYGDRAHLKEIIERRCYFYTSEQTGTATDEDLERKKTFWLVREFYFIEKIIDMHWVLLKSSKDNLLYFHEISESSHHRGRHEWPTLTAKKIEAILDAFFEQWPPIELPNYWSSDSPNQEKAYRFLLDLIWLINSDDSDESLTVLKRLLVDSRFSALHRELQSIYSTRIRKRSLQYFEPPTPQDIVNQLDHGAVVTVEGLRQVVLQELKSFQKAIYGGEFNSANRFYEKSEHLDENSSTEIIAERLNLRLEPQGISITTEHQLKDHNRSDFTASKLINSKRCLLVTEVKGQWHRELYTAASAQLYDRYSIHPDAEQQGIFLVIWFGENEPIAGRKTHGIKSADELKIKIEDVLPIELKNLIDVFVLDVSRE
jgi:hypothetical protein